MLRGPFVYRSQRAPRYRRERILAKLARYGVGADLVEREIGRPAGELTNFDLILLAGLHEQLRAGAPVDMVFTGGM